MKLPSCPVRARQYYRATDLEVANRHVLQTKASTPSPSESDPEPRNLAEGGVRGQAQVTVENRLPVVRVLVVDDAPAMRVLMEKTLKALGYQAFIAANAEEALSQLERELIDVVMSDLQMPGMSGLELAKVAKARWPHLAIILFSALISDPLRSGESTEGVDLLLAKPVKMETLKEALELLGAERRAAPQTRPQ